MICPKCKSTILEKVDFCPSCGQNLAVRTEENKKCCPSCGGEIKEGQIYCGKCGTRIAAITQINTYTTPYTGSVTTGYHSGKIKGSYFVSVIGAIISFIIRIAKQETFYSWDNLLDNRKLVGIDPDLKPFLSAIPAIVAIIVSLMIVTDDESFSQDKITAFIINLIFIALAVLFIWFDIPYAIFDF